MGFRGGIRYDYIRRIVLSLAYFRDYGRNRRGLTLQQLAMKRMQASFVRQALVQYKSFAFQKLSEKGISAFVKENTGRYISVLTNDVNTIEQSYLVQTFNLIHQSVSFLCTLIMMLWYSPALTAASVVFCALPLAASLLFGKILPEKERMVSDQNERFISHVKDFLSGFSVIKSFKAEKMSAPFLTM